MLIIEEIKQIPPDCKEMPINPTLKATVLEVGEIEAGQGKTKAKFFCILADNTGAISCTVYKENEKQKFVENLGVVIMNVMIKQSYIAITERSQVAMCKGFMIPEEIKQAAPKRQGNLPWISKWCCIPPLRLTGVKGKIIKVRELCNGI